MTRLFAPVLSRVALYAELVKFEHTVFALPFALSAMFLASGAHWPSLHTALWVVLAMVGGRTYAMGLNRIIDCQIDGQNPRTAGRTLPAGRLPRVEAWGLTLIALALMVLATLQLPILCLQLLPIALVLLTAYSYIKRFSALAHVVLGLCLGAGAIGGWIAVTGTLSAPALLFGTAVLAWVAGFDIIYACQDVDFDREAGLFSIPASWGVSQGLAVSRILHGVTVMSLVAVWAMVPGSSWGFGLAIVLTGAMLVYEHRLVSAQDLSRVDDAFFMVNGVISVLVFACILVERLVQLGLPALPVLSLQ